MRPLCFLFLLFPCVSTAQQNFEGTIRLQQISSATADTSEMVVSYGKTKVKTDIYSSGKRDLVESYIMDLDKGVRIDIDHKRKTYSIDSAMSEPEVGETVNTIGDTSIILGYRAVKLTTMYKELGIPLTMNIWVPIDLKYTVPEKFRGSYRTNGFPADNICWLKIRTIHSSGVIPREDSAMVDPIEIIHGPVDQTGFIVPPSYTVKGKGSLLKLEAVVQEQTSPAIVPPPPPPPPKGIKGRIKENN